MEHQFWSLLTHNRWFAFSRQCNKTPSFLQCHQTFNDLGLFSRAVIKVKIHLQQLWVMRVNCMGWLSGTAYQRNKVAVDVRAPASIWQAYFTVLLPQRNHCQNHSTSLVLWCIRGSLHWCNPPLIEWHHWKCSHLSSGCQDNSSPHQKPDYTSLGALWCIFARSTFQSCQGCLSAASLPNLCLDWQHYHSQLVVR